MKSSLTNETWNNQKESNVCDLAFIWFDLYMMVGNTKRHLEGGVTYEGEVS